MTMTRTYVAKRLLEHGALTAQEFLEIVGWDPREASRTLQQLLDTGVAQYQYQWATIRKRNSRHKTRLYALASSPTAAECGSLIAPMQPQPTSDTERSCHG